MSLYIQIQDDWKAAFKARETIKKDILNFVKAQLKNKEIDLGRAPNDDEVIAVLKKEIKTRKESISFLEWQWDTEELLLEKENISHLEVYLPEVMSEEQTQTIVLETIESLGITDLKKQRGQLMWAIIKQYWATIDWGVLNGIVTQMIA